MNLQETIQTILDRFGVEVLQQPKRFLSLFTDVSPHLTKEKQLLQFVMQPEVMKQFQPCDPRDEIARLSAAKRRLEGIISDDALQQVLDAFAAGLGWTARCGGSVPVVQTPVVQQVLKQAVVNPETGMTAEEMYQKGENYQKAKNDVEAVKWFRKAADLGHIEAQYSLGYHYNYGEGVQKNEAEAQKWYHKAAEGWRKLAEQGNAEAQYSLGICYYCGTGVPEDGMEAVEWYRKAAKQGHAKAQSSLGDLYYHGWCGLVRDTAKAINWYLKAAEQGNEPAYFHLGQCYFYDKKDYAEAAKWYQKSAEQGSCVSQSILATLYEQGKGVPKDLPTAIHWYKQAAAQGNETAIKALQRLNINP